jgi:membrane protease YdiL (CAAX protease family)
VESYSRLDLHGWNPLWIALAAGFGEEFLFRGALQPVVGIWFTSILFVLVHTRAYRFNKFSKRVFVQATGIFAVSVVLGFIARYAGLVTAIIVHTAVDVCGLYVIRRVAHVQAAAAA